MSPRLYTFIFIKLQIRPIILIWMNHPDKINRLSQPRHFTHIDWVVILSRLGHCATTDLSLLTPQARAFGGWAENTSYLLASRKIAEAAFEKWTNALLAEAFYDWMDHAAASKRSRHVERKAAMMFANRAIGAAWNTWLDETQ
eukprot:scaffold170235_cov37-Prasinocladus_malaysianus.AAC.1